MRQPFRRVVRPLEAVVAARVREPDGAGQPVQRRVSPSASKIDGPGLRIYLAKDGLKIIILIGGGTKKRQQQDIDKAVALWDDYKRRKASTPKGAK